LEATRKRILELNPSVKVGVKSLDVSDEAGVIDLFEQIKSEDGKADVLINNAGISRGGPIASASIKGIWADFVS
jgi:NAD(P)-dependent dehydrogenase (short-subunit alcohol dehydrogenase family)